MKNKCLKVRWKLNSSLQLLFIFLFTLSCNLQNAASANIGFISFLARIKLSSSTDSSTGTSNIPVTTNPVLSASKTITAYSIPSLGLTGIILGTQIFLVSETYTTFVPETATFTTTGKNITIGGVTQISGTTANNYSSTLTYIVTAEDGSTQNYTVIFFAPLTITGMQAWFKANSLALTNGANVTSWTDSSGNGNTISNGSNYPTYVASGIGGKPSVNFVQASNQWLYNNSTVGLGGNDFTMIAVVRPTVNGTNQGIISVGNSCGLHDKELSVLNTNYLGSGWCNVLATYDTTTLLSSGVSIIASATWLQGPNANGSNLYYNGGLIRTDPTTGTAYSGGTQLAIGRRYSNTLYFNGDIAEVFYFNVSLSTTAREKIECYLSGKYSITLNHTCQ